MTSKEDRDYFAERERQALKIAAETSDAGARAVHLQLALLYAGRARPAVGDEPPPATD